MSTETPDAYILKLVDERIEYLHRVIPVEERLSTSSGGGDTEEHRELSAKRAEQYRAELTLAVQARASLGHPVAGEGT